MPDKPKPIVEDWLNPMNKLIWIKAFKAKSPTVTLRDGRKFTIKYKQRKGVDIVEVRPVEGMVPLGFFELKQVTDNSWLDDTNGHKK
jgi:hypothetical protein